MGLIRLTGRPVPSALSTTWPTFQPARLAGQQQGKDAGQIGPPAFDLLHVPQRHHLVAVVADEHCILRRIGSKQGIPPIGRGVSWLRSRDGAWLMKR